MTTEESRNIILQAAALNARGKHWDALELVHLNLPQFDPALRFDGLKELFQAALGIGDKRLAVTVAEEIAQEFPDMPSIQDYL